MRGAYVALPDADTTPDVPTGWGDWPFPGPWPPGYTPTLAFSVDGPTELVPTTDYDSTWTLTDHTDYYTAEPTGTITWTAMLDGEELEFKFSGDEDYGTELTSDFEDVGDSFYGDAPTIVFNVTGADVGKTITLQASSEAFDGYAATQTQDIELVSVITRTYTLTMTMPSNGLGTFYTHGTGSLWTEPFSYEALDEVSPTGCNHAASPTTTMGLYLPPSMDAYYPSVGSAWVLGYSSSVLIGQSIGILESGVTHEIDIINVAVLQGYPAITYTLQVYEAGELKSTTTKSLSVGCATGYTRHWVNIDGDTGDVTLVDTDRNTY